MKATLLVRLVERIENGQILDNKLSDGHLLKEDNEEDLKPYRWGGVLFKRQCPGYFIDID